MPPHVRRRRARCRSNTPRHAVSARADRSLGRSQRLTKAKCVALIEFCKRLEWYVRGRDKGLNLDLEVAIEIARIAVSRAKDRDERGQALNSLGNALGTLGERESGTGRLEEA